MFQFWASLIGFLLGRWPRAVAVCVPASCCAARRLGMRPQPSGDVIAFVPCWGWIVVEHVPNWQRGPPVAAVGGEPSAGSRIAGMLSLFGPAPGAGRNFRVHRRKVGWFHRP